jgi:hypothetical protein
MTEEYKKLRAKILLDCTHLTRIEVGQVFDSKFYGNIVATSVEKCHKDFYRIYGFDVKQGLPRSCEYRTDYFTSDLDIVGKEPTLSDVLFWFNGLKYKYAHFEVDEFCIYDSDEPTEFIKWDLTKCYLKDQSEELIEFLNDLNK